MLVLSRKHEDTIIIDQRIRIKVLGIRGEPLLVNVARQPQTMPQYYVGHKQRVQQIDELLSQLPGLYFAGNAYEGVGIPQCIHSGEQAAQRAVNLSQPRPVAEQTTS